MLFYFKGNDSKMGDNSDKKKKIKIKKKNKNTGHRFFREEFIYEFENFSIHGSKLVLCT